MLETIDILDLSEINDYEIITSVCKTDGAEGYPVFGFRATSMGGKIFELADLSSNRQDVENLIMKLNKEQVSIDQILYIVEDYIAVL